MPLIEDGRWFKGGWDDDNSDVVYIHDSGEHMMCHRRDNSTAAGIDVYPPPHQHRGGDYIV